MKTLGDILKKSNAGQTESSSQITFDFLNVISNWSDIVGPQMAKHTHPMKISNGQLIILTRHAAYSAQLQYVSEAIKGKIIKKFPLLRKKIRKLYFKNSPSFFAQKDQDFITKEKEERKVEHLHHRFSPQKQMLEQKANEFFNEENTCEDETLDLLKSIYMQISQEN